MSVRRARVNAIAGSPQRRHLRDEPARPRRPRPHGLCADVTVPALPRRARAPCPDVAGVRAAYGRRPGVGDEL